jgi:hypothetical protein
MKKLSKVICSALAGMMLLSSMAVTSASAKTTSVKAPKITVSNTAKGVKIKWGKSTGAKKYTISRKLSTAKKFTKIKTVKGSKAGSYVDTKVTVGKKYTYAVTASNGSASAQSATKKIVRLIAPTNVKAKADSTSYDIKVSWSKAKGAKKYNVYHALVSGSKVGKYSLIDTVTGTSTYDYDITTGKTYKYKVEAVNGSSKSAKSSASSKVSYMPKVEMIAALSTDYEGVTLTWYNEDNISKYEIYRKATGGSYEKILTCSRKSLNSATANDSDGTISYTDKDVTLGTEYSYYIKAYSGSLTSKGDVQTITYQDADVVIKVGETKNIFTIADDESGYVDMKDLLSDNVTITATSKDESIATVDNDGNVTGVSAGKTDIVVTYNVTYSDEITSMTPGMAGSISLTATLKVKVEE